MIDGGAHLAGESDSSRPLVSPVWKHPVKSGTEIFGRLAGRTSNRSAHTSSGGDGVPISRWRSRAGSGIRFPRRAERQMSR